MWLRRIVGPLQHRILRPSLALSLPVTLEHTSSMEYLGCVVATWSQTLVFLVAH